MSTQLSPITERLEPEALVPLSLPPRYARFGNFQVDVHRQELFLDGQRVKMQAKIFQALALLLSRAGEIVTRDDVRKHLWPDMFLSNLDANVNTTMNKLRQVLGDTPENPQYIETIPRRGYSFIARLQFSDFAGAPTHSQIAAAAGEPVSAIAAQKPRFSIPQLEWPSLLRMAALLVAGMLIGALLTFVWFVAQEKSHRPVESAYKHSSYSHASTLTAAP